MPSLMDFLFGQDQKFKKLDTMSGGQNQLLQQLLQSLTGGGGNGGGYQQAMGLLQDYMNPQSDVYKNFEAPYMQQFEQQTVPMLAEKFAGFGGGMGGGLSSSGFGQALGAAGGNLQTNLAQLKSQMGRQSIQDILGMTQFGLGAQPFAYANRPASPGFFPQMFGSGMNAMMGGMF